MAGQLGESFSRELQGGVSIGERELSRAAEQCSAAESIQESAAVCSATVFAAAVCSATVQQRVSSAEWSAVSSADWQSSLGESLGERESLGESLAVQKKESTECRLWTLLSKLEKRASGGARKQLELSCTGWMRKAVQQSAVQLRRAAARCSLAEQLGGVVQVAAQCIQQIRSWRSAFSRELSTSRAACTYIRRSLVVAPRGPSLQAL